MIENRGSDRKGEIECWVAVVVLLLPIAVLPLLGAILPLPLPISLPPVDIVIQQYRPI